MFEQFVVVAGHSKTHLESFCPDSNEVVSNYKIQNRHLIAFSHQKHCYKCEWFLMNLNSF